MIAIAMMFLASAPTPEGQAGAPVLQVYAIRYATLRNFKVAALIKGADDSRRIDLAMMVWLIRGGGKNILVDSGFYRKQLFGGWDIAGYVRPDEAVRAAGVKPEEITDVIVTHAHWDHADGADLFPNATIWLQKEEYRYYTVDAWQPGGKHGGIDRDDVAFFLRANMDGRLRLVDGDKEILPGVRVYIGGRHTFASQYVAVDAKPGPIVIASDNVYLYENLDKHLPIAQTFDEASNLAAQDKMRQLVRDLRFVVPGHDPDVLKRFPKVTDNVVRIE
jgi:glyoxylase-like metal-dependent hydrolase (beta-lactamase superfamily II)